MKFFLLALPAAAIPAVAPAAIIATTVTATGPYGNDLSVINDGVFPPDATPYNAPSSVYYGSRAFAGGDQTAFTFSFGSLYTINRVLGAVDFNDDYTITFLNGAVTTGTYVHFANSGPVTFGLQNFAATITPTLATSARLTTANGDALYGVGEIEFDGVAPAIGAVPEPASWALMVGGFAAIGSAMRRRKVAVSFA